MSAAQGGGGGQPTRSTGGNYNPAGVRVRIKIESPGALPGPGGDVVMQGPGSGGTGSGFGFGAVGGGGIPRLPTIGAAPFSRVGGGRAIGPEEIAQALRESGVWNILSQLTEE